MVATAACLFRIGGRPIRVSGRTVLLPLLVVSEVDVEEVIFRLRERQVGQERAS